MISTEFKDQANYLVGFLAVLVGLAVFKDELARNTVGIFGHEFSYFDVSLPLVGAMILAAYIGGIAFFVGSVPLARFPLRKYLSNVSSVVAVIGLVYPLFLGLVLLVSWISARFDINITADVLQYSSLISASIAVYIAVVATRFKNAKSFQEQVSRLIELELERRSIATPPRNRMMSREYEFLQAYELLVKYANDYLRLRGFGTGRQGLGQLSQILSSKGVFDAEDVDDAVQINKVRNSYAHGEQQIDSRQLSRLLRDIERLRQKIASAIYELDESDK